MQIKGSYKSIYLFSFPFILFEFFSHLKLSTNEFTCVISPMFSFHIFDLCLYIFSFDLFCFFTYTLFPRCSILYQRYVLYKDIAVAFSTHTCLIIVNVNSVPSFYYHYFIQNGTYIVITFTIIQYPELSLLLINPLTLTIHLVAGLKNDWVTN